MRLACVVGGVLALVCAEAARGGNVAAWRHATKADFEKGEIDGVVVSRDGDVTLGRELKPLLDLKCASVWDLARTREGKMIAATALPGQVVEFTADGKTRPIWSDSMVQAFSLAALDDGSLLVGTGPHGVVYKISANGEAKEFYKTDALYVWDLAADSAGRIYVATGPKGEIHQIDPDGQGRLFYETKTQHVLALAMHPDGSLLAGTDGKGLLLSIDANGKASVIYDASEGEIRCIWAAPDGVIYAGTASGAASSMSGSSSSSSSSSTSSSAATNAVYRIDPSGSVRKVFSGKSLVYAIAPSRVDSADEVLAATGPDGTLYSLDQDGRGEQELARIDTELLVSLLPNAKGQVVIGTGNPGKLYQLSGRFQASGTITSTALDAKMTARFGAVSWRAETPEGTQVSLAVRSGNTQTPDATWSAWSVEQTDPAKAQANCPPGRFLQYRLTLKSNGRGATPVVRALSIRYLTANQPPLLTKISVPHVEDGDGKKAVDKLKLSWTASDPNSDDLSYKLEYRKQDWKAWVTLREELTAAEFEWDVASAPEGIFLLRVTASDQRSNPDGEELTSTMTSEPFAVDRSGPEVEAKLTAQKSGSATFDVRASDAISPVVSAAYSLDSEKWVNIYPADRLFDSTSERFQLELEKLSHGTHVLVVRATDAAGHTRSDDVVFEVK
jgi:sugar lactone lactonase YvrE